MTFLQENKVENFLEPVLDVTEEDWQILNLTTVLIFTVYWMGQIFKKIWLIYMLLICARKTAVTNSNMYKEECEKAINTIICHCYRFVNQFQKTLLTSFMLTCMFMLAHIKTCCTVCSLLQMQLLLCSRHISCKIALYLPFPKWR